MKQLKYFLVAAAWAIAACGGKENPASTGQDNLSLNPTSLSFKADGADTYQVTVTASGSWTASATESWIHFTPGSGSGNGTLNVSVARSETQARAGRILVKCADRSAEVFVSQASGQAASVDVVPAPAAFDGTKRASTTYQLLIYSFSDSDGDGVGDFKGIQNKLDYLDGLGVTALWLSPAHPTGSYHGYDVNDYSALNPKFGTEGDFKALVDAARAKNIDIYMDYVINHTGDGNPWFKDAVYDSESEYGAYYIFSSDPKTEVAAGKIPMLLPDPSNPDYNPYSEGEWYAAGAKGRYHFHLNWVSDAAPEITVTKTTEDTYTGSSGKYLYFGNGEIKEFKSNGGTAYDMVIDFESLWGFLVRTSKTSWNAGTKYGVSGRPKVALGEPIKLKSNSSVDPSNIPVGRYYHSNFAQSMPDLDYGALETAQNSPAFVSVAAAADKWINDFGVAGLRLDAVKHIYHNSWSDENPTFLKKWYNRFSVFMVGEVLDSHSMEKLYYKGLPSLFEFGFRDKVLDALKSGSAGNMVGAIIGFISDHKGYNPDAKTSIIIGNHDISRVGSELGKNVAKEKQAAALLLSAEGKPFIFQGDELGYWGDKSKHGDADIRMPLCWDKAGSQIAKKGLPDGLDGYTDMVTGNNSVEAQEADEKSILNVYKTWSQLRNTYPALATGTMSKANLQGNSIAAWYMTEGGQKLLVIHNVAPSGVAVSVSDSMDKPIALLGTATVKNKTLNLGANSSVVFEL